MTLYAVAITEGTHYTLTYYEDHGWEWEGSGIFHGQVCARPYLSEDDARNAAVRTLLKYLNS